MAKFMRTICPVVSKRVTEISMEVGPHVKNFMIDHLATVSLRPIFLKGVRESSIEFNNEGMFDER
jgi:hypothetical protein